MNFKIIIILILHVSIFVFTIEPGLNNDKCLFGILMALFALLMQTFIIYPISTTVYKQYRLFFLISYIGFSIYCVLYAIGMNLNMNYVIILNNIVFYISSLIIPSLTIIAFRKGKNE